MIPALAVVNPVAVDAVDGAGTDAVALQDEAAGGGFAAALQQLLAAPADSAVADSAPVTDPVAPANSTSELLAAGLPEQPALLAPALQAVAALTQAAQPAGVPPAGDPLHWLMLLQATAPSLPQPGTGSEVLALTDAAATGDEVAALDGAESLLRLPTAELAAASSFAGLAAASLGEATTPARDGGAVPVDLAAGELQRAQAGLEQNVLQRSGVDSAARSTPPLVLTPLHAPQWDHEFAARVSWVVERGDQLASIRLTPEQLGPVEVRLAIREGEASIWFGATQAETRAAIEQALPRLREMLAASGLSLADTGVFQQAPRDPRQGFLQADARRAALESAAASGDLVLKSRHLGLIDDYA